ncbi:MAG TPA: Uma2 family endonuclease [Planctomycetaceae bacterium]|jgi:Uma2 family endonuclease
MSTVVIANAGRIPDGITDLESFRRWAHSDDFPESGQFSYLNDAIWVDTSMEQLFSHNRVKVAITYTIMALLQELRTGQYVADRMLLSNSAAGFATEPDALYFHWSTVQSGRLNMIEGAGEGCIELEGTPDMVIEIVSRSSVHKDTVVLRELYWEAGIPEYWLIDARGATPDFQILRHMAEGYEPTDSIDLGVVSSVFNRKFRLRQEADPLGKPEFFLDCTK